MFEVYKNTRSQNKNIQVSELPVSNRFLPQISATKTYNYLVDKKEKDIDKIIFEEKEAYSPLSFYRCERGREFEKKITRMIISKCDVLDITYKSYPFMQWSNFNCKSVQKEIVSMEYGVLFSVPLINVYNKVGGIADILVRSDCIDKIMDKDTCMYPYYNEPVHYIVIEIKYSDNVNLSHIVQTLIYSSTLSVITSKCSYVFDKNERYNLVIFNSTHRDLMKCSLNWLRKILKIKTLWNPLNLTKTNVKKYLNVSEDEETKENSMHLTVPCRGIGKCKVFIMDLDISNFQICTVTSRICMIFIYFVDTGYLCYKEADNLDILGEASCLSWLKYMISKNVRDKRDVLMIGKRKYPWWRYVNTEILVREEYHKYESLCVHVWRYFNCKTEQQNRVIRDIIKNYMV